MDTYGSLVNRVLYPLWERGVRRRPTLDYLERLQRTEHAGADELRSLQQRELSALLAHAYERVPYYRRRMDEVGVHPGDLRTVDDLRALPILRRADAQASVDERCATGGPAPVITKTTGGTTGEPLVIRYDLDSEHWRQAVKLRGFGWAGYRVGDPVVHYWGLPSKGHGLADRARVALDRTLKRETWIDCTPRGEDHLREAVETLAKVQPTTIFCYAQAAADLARYINRTGSRAWGTIAVVCGAERVFPHDRAALEEAFGPAVFETYGCREVMLIATECERHEGLHMMMENLVVEILVEDGGDLRPARPGETGEVVLTDLHNLGCPFIRYANGDLATYLGDERCGCGRAHPRLQAVEGRSTETLRGADGGRVGGMVFNLAFSPLAEKVRQFQAVQHPDDSITIKIIPAPDFDDRVLDHLRKSCRKYLPGLAIQPRLVEDIPLTRSGKRRVVVVEER
jgi:phenylacetate-CoA ligase